MKKAEKKDAEEDEYDSGIESEGDGIDTTRSAKVRSIPSTIIDFGIKYTFPGRAYAHCSCATPLRRYSCCIELFFLLVGGVSRNGD